MIRPLFYLFIAATICRSTGASFQNLSFESPHINLVIASNNLYGFARTVDAIPGWQLKVGAANESIMLYNSFYLGSAGAALLPTAAPGFGNYSVILTAGPPPGNSQGPLFDSSISQLGEVPVDAQTLLFDSRIFAGSLEASVDNSGTSLVDLGLGPDQSHRFGIDVSDFSGKQMSFGLTLKPDLTGRYGNALLDNFRFSPQVLSTIPEPSTIAYLSIGIVALAWRRGGLTRRPSSKLRGRPTECR